MSHEVESMFSVRETPWHGLGTILETPPATTAEALVTAGLDWKVALWKLCAHEPVEASSSVGYQIESAETDELETTWNGVVRLSDKSVLGVVGPTYHPVQNEEAFRFFDPAIEAGLITIETAGSLKQGKRVWMLAKVAGAVADVVPGDEVNGYFLISNSHDGTTSVRAGFTGVRVVCSNTLAEAHGGEALIRINHTKNAVVELSRLQEIVGFHRDRFEKSVEHMRQLARVGIDEAELRKYVERVFAPDLDQHAPDAQVRTYVDNTFEKIRPLFEAGRGNDMDGVSGTVWAAYNAVSEFLTWERGRSVDSRIDSLWFGSSANLNARAFLEALKIAT